MLHFNPEKTIPLFIAIVLVLISISLFQLKKIRFSLIVLFFASLSLGIFMAILDPFLITWDEQFHALVAKNMMHHPFKPMLYKEVFFDYDYKNWTTNHIWLHKQPLFLWQMAISLKIWGLNAFAVRFPDILMHAILSLVVFRIGKISANEKVGYLAALFMTLAYFPLELIAGRYPTDHNDMAILFYVALSFWSLSEYIRSKKLIWLILTGVFSGCGVLVKWLIGLIIYPCWAFTAIELKNKKINWNTVKVIVISFGISLLVFVPWQIYTFIAFPAESKFEWLYNFRHLSDPVEGHTGNLFFHFTSMYKIYGGGQAVPFILWGGLIILIIRIKNIRLKTIYFSAVLITYMIFSFAATKMVSFTVIISWMFYLSIAMLVYEFIRLIQKYFHPQKILINTLFVLLALYLSFILFNFSNIRRSHTMWKPGNNHSRHLKINEMKMTEMIKSLDYKQDEILIFNAPGYSYVPIMFFTDYTAYGFLPGSEQIKHIKSLGRKPLILDNGKLSKNMKSDSSLIFMDISGIGRIKY